MVILIRAIRRGFKPYKYILVFIRPITTVYINLPYPLSHSNAGTWFVDIEPEDVS